MQRVVLLCRSSTSFLCGPVRSCHRCSFFCGPSRASRLPVRFERCVCTSDATCERNQEQSSRVLCYDCRIASSAQVESLDELEEATGGEVKSSQLGSTFISEQRGAPQTVATAAKPPPDEAEVELTMSI